MKTDYLSSIYINDPEGLRECLNLSLEQFSDLLDKLLSPITDEELKQVAKNCHQLSVVAAYLEMGDLKQNLLLTEYSIMNSEDHIYISSKSKLIENIKEVIKKIQYYKLKNSA